MEIFNTVIVSIVTICSISVVLCVALYLLCGTSGDLFENECEIGECEIGERE